MKLSESYKDLLKADQRSEGFIFRGEVVLLLLGGPILLWFLWNAFLAWPA